MTPWPRGPLSVILHCMNDPQSAPKPIPRSPQLMSTQDTGLLVVDVQEKLIPAITDHGRVVWNCRRLVDGADLLGLPVAATEQYPKGIGPTIDALAQKLAEIPEKMAFSCGECAQVFQAFRDRNVHKILVCGIEAHVCVQQTVIDLLADGWQVYLAVDALGSRFKIDYRTALGRMESAGATLTSTEAALFEWCQTADRPEFKQLSRLVREKMA